MDQKTPISKTCDMHGKGNSNRSPSGGTGKRKSYQSKKGPNPQGGSLKEGESTSFQPDISSLKVSDLEDSKQSTSYHATCLVCYRDDLPQHRAISPCGHDDVCAQCHLRLRALHGTYACPICKTLNEKLIVDVDDSQISVPDPDINSDHSSTLHHKLFEHYEMWGDDLGPNFVYREDVGMFFPLSYYRSHVLSLFSFQCKEPRCTFLGAPEASNDQTANCLRKLQDHLRSKHSLTLCNLCVENKMDFVSCLPRFTPSQLKDHESKGDTNGAFKGHPLCEFCRPLRFYDLTKLHEHLNREHYKCHLCEKRGKVNQFFKNYDKVCNLYRTYLTVL